MMSWLQDSWIWLRWNRRRRGGRTYILSTIPPRAICAEIGVWQGDFSARLIATGRVKELHLVDPWTFAPDFPARLYGGAVAKSQSDMDAILDAVRDRFSALPQVQIHRAPSRVAASQFADGYFDWLYIDGNHSYQAVLDDLRAWFSKLKPGGVICLDDYFWRDETDGLGVKDAIEAFLAHQTVASARPVGGQFILRAVLGVTK